MIARPHPRYDRAEVVVDTTIHAAACVGALAATIWLLGQAIATGTPSTIAAVAVYGLTLVAMPTVSGAYHLAAGSGLGDALRRLDQATIFLLIAGSYTPFAVIALEGLMRPGLLALVWVVAAVGIGLMIGRPRRLDSRLAVGLYVALGWCGLIALPALWRALEPATLALLAAGGVVYTAGVAFHLWERLRFHNAIWHGFVVLAAALHVAAVSRLLS